MSFYTLAVNPVRRLVNPAGCVAEIADPGILAAPAVPVPTKLLRFRGRLPAEEVHARLRRCREAMQGAERSVFLWFSEIHERLPLIRAAASRQRR